LTGAKSLVGSRFSQGGSLVDESYFGHSPFRPTEIPALAASQALPYVLSLQPQTGAYSLVHISGIGVQVPVWSAAPHVASSEYEQY
jgi:hypothetical protein